MSVLKFLTLTFNSGIETGIFEIDEQHKVLIDKVNELYNVVLTSPKSCKVIDFIEYTEFYMSIHMETEEKYMEKYNYHGTLEHKYSHIDLKNKFKILRELTNQNSKRYLSILETLKISDWLAEHLETEDKKFANFLSSKI